MEELGRKHKKGKGERHRRGRTMKGRDKEGEGKDRGEKGEWRKWNYVEKGNKKI